MTVGVAISDPYRSARTPERGPQKIDGMVEITCLPYQHVRSSVYRKARRTVDDADKVGCLCHVCSTWSGSLRAISEAIHAELITGQSRETYVV